MGALRGIGTHPPRAKGDFLMAVQAPFDKLWGQRAHAVHTRGHLIIQLPTTENNWAVFTMTMQLKSSANIVKISTSVNVG